MVRGAWHGRVSSSLAARPLALCEEGGECMKSVCGGVAVAHRMGWQSRCCQMKCGGRCASALACSRQHHQLLGHGTVSELV
eukprot:1149971-Pelagomonas_calceolata.AAC.3